ncbi:MAG TPA: AAA family ATPase [Ktedonobacterales bacterium]
MATLQPLTFAQALRRARLAAGLTQGELAERAGLAVRSVSDLERGVRRAPYRDTVERLANALELTGPERALLASAARPTHQPGAEHANQPNVASRDPSIVPFVGRAAELERLGGVLEGKGPSLLLLAGEPGIGKSRLLRETITSAAKMGWSVLEGSCQRSDLSIPYAPLVGALARHIARRTPAQLRDDLKGCSWLVRLLPELADTALVPLPRWTGAPEQERRLMFTAAGRYLANVAGPAGTLLALDDMQWAGGDALELLASLLREPGARPLCAIVAHRSAEVRSDHPLESMLGDLGREERAERLVIGALSAPEAKELLGKLLERGQREKTVSVSAVEAERVLRRTEGVPFYLVSCVRALQDGVPEGETPERAPWSVSQQIRQRAAALPDAARVILGLAAIAGRNVALWQLRAVASAAGFTPEARLDAVEAACRSGLLVETNGEDAEGFRFAHDLIHEVTLADLSAARRRGWNLLHAEALEGQAERERDQRAADIARHFLASDEPARALRYLLRAGDQAEATYAHADAEEQYRAALKLARERGDRASEARALDRLHTALANQARFEAALEVADQACAIYRELGDAEGELRALDHYGIMYVARATPERGLERLHAERARFEGQPPSSAMAHFFATLAQLYLQAGRAQDALETAGRAFDFARVADDIPALVHATYMRGMALNGVDRLADFEQDMEDVIPLSEQAGDATHLLIALSHTGNAAAAHGDFTRALERLTRAADIADRLNEDNFRCGTRCNLGRLAYIMGDWARAESEYGLAMTLYRRVGPAVWSIMAPSRMAQLRWAQGWRDEARALVEETLTGSQALYLNWRSALAREALSLEAEEALLREDGAAALVLLEPLFDAPPAFREPAAALLAWGYAIAGQAERARETLEKTLALAGRGRDILLTLEVRRIQALLAVRQRRWSEAETLLDEVIARSRDLPYPYLEARTRWVSGQLYAAWGNKKQASAAYDEAHAIFSRLGERLYAAQIQTING